MQHIDWDDLKLFFHVASTGGLVGAAERTGLSAPTIGRRMLALERTTGRTLFIRSQQGYRLAPDGEVLIERVRAMQETADSITAWHQHGFAMPIVSIGSQAWLSDFLAERTSDIRQPEDRLRLCCKTTNGAPAFIYRETDVGIVPLRPQTGNLVALRSVETAYAVYHLETSMDPDSLPWVSMGTESAVTPAEKWVFQNHEADIATWTNSQQILVKLIRSGNGRGVLPCFVGDAEPSLRRHRAPIAALAHPLWIVANADDRHRPEMRLVIDRLASLLKRHESRFRGEVPQE